MAIVLTENSNPFFIVPSYTQLNSSFNSTKEELIGDANSLDIDSRASISSTDFIRYDITNPISSCEGKVVGFSPYYHKIGIWNTSHVQDYGQYTLGIPDSEEVPGFTNLPINTMPPPSVILSMTNEGIAGNIQDFSYFMVDSSTFFAYRFQPQSNPIYLQNVLVRVDISGRLRILINSFTYGQVRYHQINPADHTSTSSGIVCDLTPNSVGIIDNAVRVSGQTLFRGDGTSPDLVIGRTWDSHRRLADTHQPTEDGVWFLDIPTPQYDITFLKNGCQPVAHGPMQV